MRKEHLFLIIGIILLALVVVSFLIFSPGPRSTSPTSTSSPQPSRYPIISAAPAVAPLKMADLPYLPQDRGGGIDVRSQVVVQSKNEITKLIDSLPYQQVKKLSNGREIEILIPAADFQLNQWTLTVQIFGIDYQLTSQEAEYVEMRSSFIEAANTAFSWMRREGADPSKIIISWGDREFIQKRAEEWLSQ